MIINQIKARDYLSPSGLPDNDFVINPYTGCPHACVYCYASFMKRFSNHKEPWGDFVDVKVCSKKINLEKIKGKKIFISSVTDPYNPAEKKFEMMRDLLKQLISSEAKITVCTKSNLIMRDIDLLTQLKDVSVALSINTLDENFKNDMDHAPLIKDRLNALKMLHTSGLRTILFMSPIFPQLTDYRAIIESSHPFVDEYWFENLNLRDSYKTDILNYIKTKHAAIYPLYDQIYNRGNISFWDDLKENIVSFCCEHTIKYRLFFHHDSFSKLKK